MGVVYKALDLSLDRFVAVKFLPAEFISNPDRRMRFVREAKSASALNHPCIITVHEINTDHEQPFIVMEYVEGQPLNELMAKRRLSLVEALTFAIQIADALAAAHSEGISTTSGTWRFGLARLAVNSRSLAEPSRYLWAENGSSPSISKPSPTAPTRLVYQRAVIGSNLYSLDLAGARDSRDPFPLRQAVFAPSTRQQMDPQFSPDGRKVTFASDRSGNLAIWLCNRDGSSLAQLTNIPECTAGSPLDCAAHGNFDIYVVSAATGHVRRLTSDASEENLPSWSHDGHWIYFTSNRAGSQQIWKMPAEGGRAVQVTRGGGFDSFESPDGKLLYYAKASTPGLWSVPVEGGPETRVLDSVRRFWWAVADAGIYFVTSAGNLRHDATAQLNFYSFETRTVAQVGTIENKLDADTPSVVVSRDGRQLLVVQEDQAGSDLV